FLDLHSQDFFTVYGILLTAHNDAIDGGPEYIGNDPWINGSEKAALDAFFHNVAYGSQAIPGRIHAFSEQLIRRQFPDIGLRAQKHDPEVLAIFLVEGEVGLQHMNQKHVTLQGQTSDLSKLFF